MTGGKQWQTTPKNLPRMQCTKAIPVAWLSSGLCPNRPKGWIPIIKIMTGKTGHFTWRQIYIFDHISLFNLRMTNVSVKSCTESQNTHFVFNSFFFENHAVCEIMWKNTVEPGRPEMTVWRMRIACWVPKAKHTHTHHL